MGPYDYYVYSNSLVNQVKDLNDIPIKTVGTSWVTVGDVGKAEDANQIQYNDGAGRRPEIVLHPHHEARRGYQHH